MGQNSDLAVGLGAAIAIVIIIAVVVIWATSPSETESTGENESVNIQKESATQQTNAKMDTEVEVLEFIKNYKGKDNSGQNLMEILSMLIVTAYPDEKILENPSTSGGFSVLPASDNYSGVGNWNVEFSLKTYRESVSFKWVVDSETDSVYARNDAGKSILDGLDAFD